MNRLLAILVGLAVLAAAGAAAYQAQRERSYRDLLAEGDQALRNEAAVEAIEAYTGALELRPDSVLAYLRRGEALLARGDLGAAAGDFRRASDLDPLAVRPLEALGDARDRRGWHRQAAEAYEARLALDDTSPHVTYKLALARYRAGQLELAVQALQRTLILSERMPEAHYLLGMCHRDAGRAREAVAAFEQAVSLDPALSEAREELADLYGLLNRTAEQIEQIQIMSGLSGTQAGSQIAVGLAHARAARTARDSGRRQRHADLAVLTLGDALEENPDQPVVYGALGGVWLRIAEEREDAVALSKALEALSRVAATTSASSEMLMWYGRALRLDGQLKASLRALQQAIRRFPIAPAALIELAEVAELNEQRAVARAARVEYAVLTEGSSSIAAR